MKKSAWEFTDAYKKHERAQKSRRVKRWGAWATVPLSAIALVLSNGRGLGRILGRIGAGLGHPWMAIILGGASLLLIGTIVSCVRKGYALNVIPIGLIVLASVLIVLSMHFRFKTGNLVIAKGFVIAGVISFTLMPVAVVPVNLYYRKQGTLPERNQYSPAFMIGFLIFFLIAVTLCVVMYFIS
jgi:hypothetical protein